MERPWARLAYHALAEHHKAHLRRCASLPSRKQPWRALALQAAEACMVLDTLLYMVVLALAQVQPPIAAAQQLRDSLRVPLAVLYTVELGARAALLHWPRPGPAQQQAAALAALQDAADSCGRQQASQQQLLPYLPSCPHLDGSSSCSIFAAEQPAAAAGPAGVLAQLVRLARGHGARARRRGRQRHNLDDGAQPDSRSHRGRGSV
jgi:hypothetical protein